MKEKILNVFGILLIGVSALLYVMVGGLLFFPSGAGLSAFFVISALAYFVITGFLAGFAPKKKLLTGLIACVVLLLMFAVVVGG